MNKNDMIAQALLACGYAPEISPVSDNDGNVVHWLIARIQDEHGIRKEKAFEQIAPFYSGSFHKQECYSRRQLDALIDWLHDPDRVNIWINHYLRLPENMRNKSIRHRLIQTVHACFDDPELFKHIMEIKNVHNG